MNRQVYLAYDGSINSDWVSRYAIRMAAATSAPLRVLHVRDGARDAATIDASLRRLEADGIRVGVSVEAVILPRRRDVESTLSTAAAAGERIVIVCGLRVRESGRGLLQGTVSEALLRRRRHDVLAIRVVAPGMLGAPRHVLYSVSENPHSAARAGGFLRLLAPGLELISLLTITSPSRFGSRRVTMAYRARMRARGRLHLEHVQQTLCAALAPHQPRFDEHVAITGDWPNEIVRHAARIRAQMLLLGTSERTLPQRVLHGNPLERVLHNAPCDVAIFSKARGG